MKLITIDGSAFSDMAGFYDEIQRKFCPDFSDFGRNLDAFNDVLYGGVGGFEAGEPIEIIWQHSQKSRADLTSSTNSGTPFFQETVQIIQNHNIKLDLQ